MYSPKISVLIRVKKNGSQERQLKAEVVVGTISITKRIRSTFEFMLVKSLHRNCLDMSVLDSALLLTHTIKFELNNNSCERKLSGEAPR